MVPAGLMLPPEVALAVMVMGVSFQWAYRVVLAVKV